MVKTNPRPKQIRHMDYGVPNRGHNFGMMDSLEDRHTYQPTSDYGTFYHRNRSHPGMGIRLFLRWK